MLYQKIKRRLGKYVIKAIPERIYKKHIAKKSNLDMSTEQAVAILQKYRINNATSAQNPNFQKDVTDAEPIDLSIIIPCYNVERYLKQCLDSILNQKTTYRYIVYAVNDGSTDNTDSILRQYEKFDSVRVLRQQNAGQGNARNNALALAHSQYIMFVDSDDYLGDDCIQKMLDMAYTNDLDIVEGGARYFNDAGKTLWTKEHPFGIFDYEPNRVSGFPWNKVIKSHLFDGIRFVEHAFFEDTLGHYLLYPRAKKIGWIEGITYHYRKNRNGTMLSKKMDYRQLDSLYVTLQLVKDAAERGMDMDYTYKITLDQVKVNQSRIYFMSLDAQQAAFVLTCDLFATYFGEKHTGDPKTKVLEDCFKQRDFPAFYRYMRLN